MPRILVSGFEPFGRHNLNPTARFIEALQSASAREGLTPLIPPGAEVRAVLLPVTFEEAFARLEAEIKNFQPDAVIAMGLAGGREAIEVERVAINCLDAEIPDNKGEQPRDLPIDPAGPAAHFSTLPLRSLVTALLVEGIPARISNTAGTYVCNFLFYRLQELTAGTPCRSGFVHVPLLPEQITSPAPSLDFDLQLRALQIILRTVCEEIRTYASRP